MSHTWNVVIHLFDAQDVTPAGRVTAAHALLRTSAGTTLDGYGRARRNPEDVAVQEIGEELAAARALRDLADRLLRATSDDISAIEHERIRLLR